MAQLTSADFTQIKKLIKQDIVARSIVKSWDIDRATWASLFQTCEDYFVNAFTTQPTTSYKSAIDAITPTTVQQAKMIFVIWSRWKAPQII